ncbi:MAG: NEL-type E3 ubiquitin ligase domain-containing protein, partial [Candidatus Rhabdochlamydia sp.]
KGLKVKGNLNLRNCKKLIDLPEDLEVGQDLNLSKCKALTAVPKGLKVKRNLNLSECMGLTYLPKNLEVGEDLNLSECEALTTVPKGLKIKGDLDLSYCIGLTDLPEDLEVGQDLNLSKCKALTAVPKGLKVKRNLNLYECMGLTYLPENLEVGEDLNLSGCKALTAVPKRLKIKGNLNLSYCTGLTHLPEDLEIGNNLNLSHCIALTALSPTLKLGGNLDLSDCTYLTSLPNWITTLGSCSNGEERTVYLTGCGLSPAVMRRLEEDTVNIEGMQFHFSIGAADDYIIEFSTLLPAIQFWQEEAGGEFLDPETVCHKLHQNLTEVQDHENLLTFLIRLTGTEDYYNSSTRSALAVRVLTMLQLMETDETFCHHAAFLIHQGLSSCDDRVMTTLDDIGFYQKLCHLERPSITEEELKIAGRGFFLLEKLNQNIRKYIKTLRFVDEVEVHMAFHTRLQEMLHLPIETKNMLFRRYVDISDEKIDRVGEEVLQEETEAELSAFLATWDPWIRYQRRVSIMQWDLLPNIERALCSTDICPYLQDAPIKPILYRGTLYDYEAFIRRYIEKGVDLYGEKVALHQLFRIHIPQALPPSLESSEEKRQDED